MMWRRRRHSRLRSERNPRLRHGRGIRDVVPDVLVDTDVFIDHLRGRSNYARESTRLHYSVSPEPSCLPATQHRTSPIGQPQLAPPPPAGSSGRPFRVPVSVTDEGGRRLLPLLCAEPSASGVVKSMDRTMTSSRFFGSRFVERWRLAASGVASIAHPDRSDKHAQN